MWAGKYIGIPYSTLNCAELVAEVLEKEFARSDIANALRGFPQHNQEQRVQSKAISECWPALAEKVYYPEDGYGVILKVGSRLSHMGIVAETPKGLQILHTVGTHGSIIEPIDKLMTCTVQGFYKWK